jgi:uncharacterized protein YidB (DUF937 family)
VCLDLAPSSRRGQTVCLAMRPEARLDAIGVLFEVSDHPPAWFSVPERDLQPHLADMVYRGALQGLEQTWQRGTPAQVMHAMIATANARFLERLDQEHAQLAGSIGHAVGFVLAHGELAIGWLGEARGYIVRGEAIEPATADHSLANEARQAGVAEDEIARLPPNIIVRCVGGRDDVGVPSVVTRRWTAEDAFVAVTRATDEAAPLGSLGPALSRATTARAVAATVAQHALGRLVQCGGVLALRGARPELANPPA